jgi:hypothetical protein
MSQSNKRQWYSVQGKVHKNPYDKATESNKFHAYEVQYNATKTFGNKLQGFFSSTKQQEREQAVFDTIEKQYSQKTADFGRKEQALYQPQNMIGFTGPVKPSATEQRKLSIDFSAQPPSVYFESQSRLQQRTDTKTVGHLTQTHGMVGNIGYEAAMDRPGYRMENVQKGDKTQLQESYLRTNRKGLQKRTVFHTSRNQFRDLSQLSQHSRNKLSQQVQSNQKVIKPVATGRTSKR